jgi:hypothetical protein
MLITLNEGFAVFASGKLLGIDDTIIKEQDEIWDI